MKINVSPYLTIDDAKKEAISRINIAAAVAQARYLTPRKIGGEYREKQIELKRWTDAGKPQNISIGEYPWADMDAQSDGEILPAGILSVLQQREIIIETLVTGKPGQASIGMKISGYERAAKNAIGSATTETQVETETEFFAGMLDKI